MNPSKRVSTKSPFGCLTSMHRIFDVIPFSTFSRHTMTKHQYYLQLRKDILEERVRCDTDNAMMLASLALQAEFGDYQSEVGLYSRTVLVKSMSQNLQKGPHLA